MIKGVLTLSHTAVLLAPLADCLIIELMLQRRVQKHFHPSVLPK